MLPCSVLAGARQLGYPERDEFMTSVLRAERLQKSYGKIRAVKDVTIEVAPGEIYGLLGPNGSGKTTTLSMLAGILQPDAGSVLIGGLPVSQPRARKRLGLVPQEVALYPQLTAAENIRYFGRMQGMSGGKLSTRTAEVLEMVDLAAHATRRVEKFSSGMRRRANIAAALVHEPDVIILDEPTVGVDSQSRNAILDEIRALADKRAAVVFASHYMYEVERLCTRLSIIDSGHIIASGTVEDLMATSAAKSKSRIVVTTDAMWHEQIGDKIRTVNGVNDLWFTGNDVHIGVDDADSVLSPLVQAMSAISAPVSSVRMSRPSLEDVFLELTGKDLRE